MARDPAVDPRDLDDLGPAPIDVLGIFTLSVIVLNAGMSFVSGSRDPPGQGRLDDRRRGPWILLTFARTPFLFPVMRTLLTGASRERAELNWRESPTHRHVPRFTTAMWGVPAGVEAGTGRSYLR
ncbi:hypothetical protein FPZ12_040035 [Amycolatopsis acidicola]|uniref:Uncharacterized protein n=1 Tax=Amycolatopsis acidicola TaxID=2596893 RepID=A0A5N0UQE1_9PSEU|nr:hypothetical protein [Amycolatopsis acidicola]KAA9150935.1 hypothetical protein FPZ12_040035 [Amycolatopsis acidicola]